MSGHLALVAETVKGEQHCVVTDGFVPVPSGEHESTADRYLLEFAKNENRLRRKRQNMLRFHLHSTSGNNPQGIIQIELHPFRAHEFVGYEQRFAPTACAVRRASSAHH